jgi:hypothetical protein
MNPPLEDTRANDAPWWRDDRIVAALVALVVFLLVYGTELGTFSLSIDEELATIRPERGVVWLQQGRWGMALVTLLLPNFEAIPVLSTMLFGAGLVFVAWRATGDLRLSRAAALLFAVVHTGFPMWLHIGEFNTLAGGFCFGIAAAVLGAGLVAQGGRAAWIGVALLAFANSVYQTLALYSLLYLGLVLHARCRDELSALGWRGSLVLGVRVLAFWVAGLALYWVVQKGALAASGLSTTYVGKFVQLELLRNQPQVYGERIRLLIGELTLGTHAMYLGWGAAILFLSWLGVVGWPRRGERIETAKAVLGALSVVLAIVILLAPAIVSAGTLPLRAYVALPLLAAWLASRTGPLFERLSPWVLRGALAYFTIVATSIGATLFYAEEVVHTADAALTHELVREIRKVAPPGPITFTLSGTHTYPFNVQVQRVDVFGTSFYEHDGGNVYRVNLFMQVLGYNDLQPVVIGSRPGLVAAAQAMPAWPQPGSVRAVDGVVVVKLGEPTAMQLHP